MSLYLWVDETVANWAILALLLLGVALGLAWLNRKTPLFSRRGDA